MNTSNIKRYAPKARNAFIAAVSKQANKYGITESAIAVIERKGDLALINGQPFPATIIRARDELAKKVEQQGFTQVMEQVAYSWFNRFCAIRYMELKGFLDHGRRVLSHPEQTNSYQILDDCLDIEMPGLDMAKVHELKLAGDKDEELYRLLLLAQCHALHSAMPFLFESIDDESELLLPENLTKTDSLIRDLVTEIPEEDWQEVEIIGWLYQFYISEKKDEVIGKVVKSEDIPAATQLFTPNWIVKYLVQNSVGRQWLQTYPDSPLKGEMEYYIEPAEQTAEVQAQLAEITPDQIDPLEIKVLDPAVGSGHILVEAYKVLKAIYEERGFRSRDIPKLILENNLFGLDIDDRAAQLAGFALMMLAREDDRRIFTRNVTLNVFAIQETKYLDFQQYWQDLEFENSDFHSLLSDIWLAFEEGKTVGSLVEISDHLESLLAEFHERLVLLEEEGGLFHRPAARVVKQIIQQSRVLGQKYDVVLANPPYMGSKFFSPDLKSFLKKKFPVASSDIYPAFIDHGLKLVKESGFISFVTLQNWMFGSGMKLLRSRLMESSSVEQVVQVGFNSFPSMNSKFAIAATILARPVLMRQNVVEFYNLNDAPQSANKKDVFEEKIRNNNSVKISQEEFECIPDNIFAYKLDPDVRDLFSTSKTLKDIASPRRGLATGDNPQFIRAWFEVPVQEILLDSTGPECSVNSDKKWHPYNMGGDLRKWYGNNTFVIDWGNDGYEIKNLRSETGRLKSRPQNVEAYFYRSITWKEIGIDFCAREGVLGSICDQTSDFLISEEHHYPIIGFINSSTAAYIMDALNPTLHFNVGTLSMLPISSKLFNTSVSDTVKSLVGYAKNDWDSQECSWDFKGLNHIKESESCSDAVNAMIDESKNRLDAMIEEEENLNRAVKEGLGLTSGISMKSNVKAIGITCESYSASVKKLLSYSVGCMMGRYSLDRDGLVYAGSKNNQFESLLSSGAYQSFPADDDGIVPLSDQEWFSDDATNRFREFIKVVWGKETLRENLDFVAESLCLNAIKPKKGEDSLDTIRRYLSSQFYKDHLKTYKKRPIYWLFSSGKNKAFECLVYLHRYNEGTLARMRTEYVIPLTAKLATYVEKLERDLDASSATSEKKRLEKEIANLHKQQAELSTFDEKLRHYADQRISLDLDDGVKVNYGKFGDLLANVKEIHGKVVK